MTSTLVDSSELDALHQEILSAFAGAKDFVGPTSANWDAVHFANSMLPGLVNCAITNPTIGLQAKAKAYSTSMVSDPAAFGSKSWFSDFVDTVGDVASTVGDVASTVAQFAGKDFKPSPPTMADVVKMVPSYRLQDKSWVDWVSNAVQTLAPVVLDAIQGTKEFRDATYVPTLTIPSGKDKSWFDDALSVASKIVPIAVSVLA